jgi:hypothetical protein
MERERETTESEMEEERIEDDGRGKTLLLFRIFLPAAIL